MSCVVVLSLSILTADAPAHSEREAFERLHSLLLPLKGEERWREVPWASDLWEARRLAFEQGKPIFLWEMDGNPLGCT
jgi:hypothetical protein